MPSSYTPNDRFEQQFTGENVNTWGNRLNNVIAMIDLAIAGFRTIALTGNYTLTSVNGNDDEARNAILKMTGTGAFAVTIPSVSKVYDIWNACTGTVTITTGAGSTADILPGEIMTVVCDASSVYRVVSQSMGGARLQNVGAPVAPSDAVTKAYADALAWQTQSGILPAQPGNAGSILTTNGTNALWETNTISNIADYASDQKKLRDHRRMDGGFL